MTEDTMNAFQADVVRKSKQRMNATIDSMDWIKVEDGCYQHGKFSVEYDYEASERDAMQWNVFAMGEFVSSHPTLRIGKAMVRVYQERGHC